MSFEVLLIDKIEGETSFSSLSSVKKKYGTNRVGHAGTLDKFATGLMIVLVGNATKLNSIFSGLDKEYIARVSFGEETDTLDPEGKVVRRGPVPSEESVRNALELFIGNMKQIPPMYSAIHINGKRLYKEARKGTEIDVPERNITVHEAKILSFNENEAIIRLSVSKGTYIRSIARDLGRSVGSAAHLTALRRTGIGKLTLSDLNLTTEEILKKTGLFSVIDLDERFKKEIFNGWIDKRAIISDTDKSLPGAFLRFGCCVYGIAEKEDGKITRVIRMEDGNI